MSGDPTRSQSGSRAAKGRFDCADRDCPKGSRTTGDPVFRISPKGERFMGLCAEHYAEWKRQHG